MPTFLVLFSTSFEACHRQFLSTLNIEISYRILYVYTVDLSIDPKLGPTFIDYCLSTGSVQSTGCGRAVTGSVGSLPIHLPGVRSIDDIVNAHLSSALAYHR